MPARVLIVDDHLAVREGVRAMLGNEPDLLVVGEAADGVAAIAAALALRPDVIVLDNSMPGHSGLEVARRIHPELPDTAIVFLTLDPGIRELAFASGATSVVLKDAPPEEFLEAVRAAVERIGGSRASRARRGVVVLLPVAPPPAGGPLPSSDLPPAPTAPLRPDRLRRPERGSAYVLPHFLTRRRLAVALVLALLMFVVGLGAIVKQAARIETRGELTIFVGNVQLRPPGGAFAVVATGARVVAGDTVRTLSGSHAVIAFFDGSIVVLEPETELTLAALDPLGVASLQVLLRQASGTTWQVVDRAAASGARYVVETPTGSASARAAAFTVSVRQERTVIRTTDGQVEATGGGGAAVAVAAGQATTIAAAGTPSPPAAAAVATLAFTFDRTTDAVVVDAAGRSAGMRDGRPIRHIPGSTVERRGSSLLVAVPAAAAGQLTSLIVASSGATRVAVRSELRDASGGLLDRVDESRAVVAGVARGGVFLTGSSLIAIGDEAAQSAPVPISAAIPPAPTPNPLFRFLPPLGGPGVGPTPGRSPGPLAPPRAVAAGGRPAGLTADPAVPATILGIAPARSASGLQVARDGAFTGEVVSISATGNARRPTDALLGLAAPLTRGHLLRLAVTGPYDGAGALYLDLTRAGGRSSGSGLVIDAADGRPGRFIDLQVAGGSRFSVTPTTVITANDILQTGAGSLRTGSGPVVLNGTTTVARGGAFVLGGSGATPSTPLTAHHSLLTQIAPGAELHGTCVFFDRTVAGAAIGDTVILTPTPVAGGLESVPGTSWAGYVAAADTVRVRLCDHPGFGGLGPPWPTQSWRIDVWRH